MASFSCGVEMQVCRKCVGSFDIGTKVLKNGLEDEESESLPSWKRPPTVYKIFEDFQIKSSLRC